MYHHPVQGEKKKDIVSWETQSRHKIHTIKKNQQLIEVQVDPD